jgi:hypothetical protein
VASPWLRGKNIKYKATIAFNQLRNADAVSYSVQSVQYKSSDSLGAYWQCVPNYALIKIYLRYLLKLHKRFIWLLFKTLAQLCFLPPIKNNFNNTYFLLRRWQDKVTTCQDVQKASPSMGSILQTHSGLIGIGTKMPTLLIFYSGAYPTTS